MGKSATGMMFRKIVSSYILALVLFGPAVRGVVLSVRHQAAPVVTQVDQAAAAARKVTRPLPFGPGEVLTYNVGFSKLILSGSIGQLKLTVKNSQRAAQRDVTGTPNDAMGPDKTESKLSNGPAKREAVVNALTVPAGSTDGPAGMEFSAEVTSKGFFTRLFGIKIEDSYGAIVSSEDFGLSRSWKDMDQGELHRHNETRVDRERGTISYSEYDRKNPAAQKVTTGKSPGWILDLLSAVYFIRTQELKTGSTITLPITDVGKVYMIDVVPGKMEEVEVEAGRFKSIQLDLKIFDGKYIRRSGQLSVWLSNDTRRLPVRARLKSSGTTVNITLARQSQLG
jgi:hypothetical protein